MKVVSKVLRTYVYGTGIDNLLAMTSYSGEETNTYYYITDHLGSVHAVVDSSGSVVESYRYDAWGRVSAYNEAGNPITESAIGNRYLWQGREYSWKTGLYYFRARWYDPVVGRWLSKDPIGISGGLNQYVFCGGNPVNFVDPLGLARNGNAFLNTYANRIMVSPMNPVWVVGNLFDTRLDIGVGHPGEMYEFRGKEYRSDRMGNIAAGYSGATAWGVGPGAIAMILAELATNKNKCPDDAYASFRDNAIGMGYAFMDDPAGIIQNTLNPANMLTGSGQYWMKKFLALMFDKLTGSNTQSLRNRFQRGFIFDE